MNTLRQLGQKYNHWSIGHWALGIGYFLDLLVLAVLAGTFRIWGIGFDLPNLYHRDEAKYVSIPLTILKSGDYNPHFFNYPTFFFYLLSVAYILYFLFMASRGRLGNLDGLALPEQVLPNVVGRATMPSQFLIGRGMVALSGVLTVLLVYWIGRKAYNRRAGFLAALLFSCSPIHIRNSHFIAPDVTMILVAMASFCFSYQVLREGRRQDYLLAGFLAGLAMSTKYNAYPIFVPLLVAHLINRSRRALLNTDLLLALLAGVAGFFLGTPYALLDLPAFLNGLAFELRHYAMLGDPGTEGQNALFWYASYLVRTEGLVPLVAGVEAVRDLVLARSTQGRMRIQKTLWLLSFPVVYILLVSSYAVKNDRTVLTIVPFLAILAGAFLDGVFSSVQTWLAKQAVSSKQQAARSYIRYLLLTTCCLLLFFWPVWRAVQINMRFMQDDVRTQVTQWMEAELPPGSRVAGEYYSPLLVHSIHQFRWVDRAIDQPISWYEANADYVVFVENRYGGFYLDPSRYPAQIAAYEAMFSQFTLVKEFQGGALGNPCRAKVYRVKP